MLRRSRHLSIRINNPETFAHLVCSDCFGSGHDWYTVKLGREQMPIYPCRICMGTSLTGIPLIEFLK